MLSLRGLSVIVLCAAPLQAASLNAPAPKFALTDSHHQRRALSEYRGKVVFINFWASWCAPCQAELPELNHLTADYKGKKVQILTINVDEDRAEGQKRLASLGLTHSPLVVLWDSKSKVVSAYNIESMPSSFILDSHGVIRFAHEGFHNQDPATWRQEIESLLSKN